MNDREIQAIVDIAMLKIAESIRRMAESAPEGMSGKDALKLCAEALVSSNGAWPHPESQRRGEQAA